MEDTPQGGAGGAPGRHQEPVNPDPDRAAATKKHGRAQDPPESTVKTVRAGAPVAEQTEQNRPHDTGNRHGTAGRE
ncbi:hypothetical protein ACIA8O_36200 [Kitasatospora sp. NPDC051853]|uniref:hypothetical protein n=1 Tax=Kitasatospora sp. NPDC051853 TaxID=3364058 RepID=UPI0037A0E5EC